MIYREEIRKYMDMLHPIEIIAPTLSNAEWFARIPLLPGCMTQAPDLETLQENIMEAKRLWIETMLEDKQAIPEP